MGTKHTGRQMARHDYDLPPDWAGMTDEERVQWLTDERNRRQAVRQGTIGPIQRQQDRFERRAEARACLVSLSDNR